MTSGMFELYTTTVEIDGNNYKIKPLSGRYLPKLYKLIAKFQEIQGGREDISPEELFMAFDEETVSNLHELSLATFKSSYPNQPEEELDTFVSQNLLRMLGVLIQVNLGQQENEPKGA